MADRNPLLVTENRSILDRILRRGAEGHGDPSEVQRIQAELEKTARIAELRRKAPRRRAKGARLEAFLSIKVGEPGSRPKLTGVAARRALRRSERRFYGRRHGRQYHVAR